MQTAFFTKLTLGDQADSVETRFRMMPVDITNSIVIPINTPNIVLYVFAIDDKYFEVNSSFEIGSTRAARSMYIPIILASLNIGTIATTIIPIIPITPPVFPIILVAPTTTSKLSEKNFPTTGTKFDTAACVVFTPSESTDVLRDVSNDKTPRNTVRTTPTVHSDTLENIFDIFSNFIFSDIEHITLNATDIDKSGITKYVITPPTKLAKNKSNGCIIPVVVIFPVAISTANKNGDITCIKVVCVWTTFVNIFTVSTNVATVIVAITIKHARCAIFVISLFFSSSRFDNTAIITTIINMVIAPLIADEISLKKRSNNFINMLL